MDNESRQGAWQRNPQLEAWLEQTARWLAPAQAAAESDFDGGRADWPQIFVLGAPRSGTTLMMQWLAASGAVAYPSNLMARFPSAPAIGASLQRLLSDESLAFRDELSDVQPQPVDFASDLGKTSGALAPNEFWYLWRRFLPTTEIEPLGARIGQVDRAGLRRAIGSVAAVLERPFAAKGLMLQYDLAFFAELFPRAVFLHVQRDGLANAASLLRARQSFFGSTQPWYSAKPPGYEALLELEPEAQVCGQVAWTQQAIEHGLQGLPAERHLTVPYGAFCADPAQWHQRLWERVAALASGSGTAIDGAPEPAYTGPAGFACSDGAASDSLRAAWDRVSALRPTP